MKQTLILALLALLGCDARVSQINSIGLRNYIKCYSGNLLIYEGMSTGKIISDMDSNGRFFKEEGTDKLIEVSGNCVIETIE